MNRRISFTMRWVLIAWVASASPALPCPSEGLLERVSQRIQQRVVQRIPELFSSISPSVEAQRVGTVIFDSNVSRIATFQSLETNIRKNGRILGAALSSYDSHSKAFQLVSIDFGHSETDRVPSFVRFPGVPDLVPQRGVPTYMWVRLKHLRMAGVQFGDLNTLQKIMTTGVTNRETIVEMAQIPSIRAWLIENTENGRVKAGAAFPALYEQMAQHLLETQTGRNLHDLILQAGFCVAPGGVEVRGTILDRMIPQSDSTWEPAWVSESILRLQGEGVHLFPKGFEITVRLSSCP